MRLVVAFSVLALVVTQASAAEHRWTIAFAQGTTEAIVGNERGSSVNIYCPSGQSDTTPGMIVQADTVKPRAGETVTLQFVIDGKSHAFALDEIQFLATGEANARSLSSLIDALVASKSRSFVVEFPKLGVTERFSLLGARKAVTYAKEFLDGCA